MRFAGLSFTGRCATRLASLFAPPHMARLYLRRLSSNPYVDPQASIAHSKLKFGPAAFIADRVVLFEHDGGGEIAFGDGAVVLRDCILETGQGGSISIGDDTFLHPRCQVMAYVGDVDIGAHVAIAPNCAFYSYNHGSDPDELVKRQPLETRGGIRIGDGAWLGYGVIVLDGVTIGDGAIIGAGAVVTHDIPENAIAVGNPARVISRRGE